MIDWLHTVIRIVSLPMVTLTSSHVIFGLPFVCCIQKVVLTVEVMVVVTYTKRGSGVKEKGRWDKLKI